MPPNHGPSLPRFVRQGELRCSKECPTSAPGPSRCYLAVDVQLPTRAPEYAIDISIDWPSILPAIRIVP